MALPLALAQPVEILPGWVAVSRIRLAIFQGEKYIPYPDRWQAVAKWDAKTPFSLRPRASQDSSSSPQSRATTERPQQQEPSRA